MTRRIIVLVTAVALLVAGTAAAGAALAWPLKDGHQTGPVASNLNTASQKSLGNTGTFVDVTDNPVSLPSEKTIYPPRTGNAGLVATAASNGRIAPLLVAATAALLAGARLATRSRAD